MHFVLFRRRLQRGGCRPRTLLRRIGELSLAIGLLLLASSAVSLTVHNAQLAPNAHRSTPVLADADAFLDSPLLNVEFCESAPDWSSDKFTLKCRLAASSQWGHARGRSRARVLNTGVSDGAGKIPRGGLTL